MVSAAAPATREPCQCLAYSFPHRLGRKCAEIEDQQRDDGQQLAELIADRRDDARYINREGY